MKSSEMLANVLTHNNSLRCHRCLSPQAYGSTKRFCKPPELFVVEIPAAATTFPQVEIEASFRAHIGEYSRSYELFGIIYLGGGHFTARFIMNDGSVWYHDGQTTGSRCERQFVTDKEWYIADGRNACLLMYFTGN